MSYREYTIYNAVCDGDLCGFEFEHDEFGGWLDKTTADEVAEADDWTATKGRHLCPACAALVVQDPADVIEQRHSAPGPNDVELPLDGAS